MDTGRSLTAEEQVIQDRIDRLQSRIAQHKAQKSSVYHDSDYSNKGWHYRSAPYPQQPYRPGRGRFAPTHRNKTLVLNQGSQSTAPGVENQPPNASSSAWVSRTGRHLQLINRDVYERETQQRAEAIEHTHKQKQLAKDHQEKALFMSNLQKAGRDTMSASSNLKPVSRYELEVEGVRFHVTKQGSKLVKAPDDLNPITAIPKVTCIYGVKFYRTKNGNLVRHGVVQAQRHAGNVTKVTERCKAFSWTGTCPKGPSCRYVHDVTKTAICRTWLLKGDCPKGDNCDLSHEITEERTPLCVHYANGNCNNPSCSYVHAKHSAADPVCRTFGLWGYCEKGAQCPHRHVFECPDFSNTGVCRDKGCKRPHIERASILRKANKRASSQDEEDLSSDEEDAVDSDDVDSDEVEEFIGQNDQYDPSFAEQKDFIGFT